jgi:hypothetical protein
MLLERDGIRLAGLDFGGEGPAALLPPAPRDVELHHRGKWSGGGGGPPDGGHDLHLDSPDAWRAAVSRFLDALHAG